MARPSSDAAPSPPLDFAPAAPAALFVRRPLLRELICEQAPLVLGTLLAALLVCYFQYGFVPGAARPFPVAGVGASALHLVAMGFVTGYAMAVVGQASGTFTLAYCASVLGFNGVGLSPTTLVVTFLNPFGALMGFWRARQWNLDMAIWLCIGAVLGAPLGPLARVYGLSDPVPFKALIGVALVITAVQLCIEVSPWYLRRAARQRAFKTKFDRSGLPPDFRIATLERSLKRVRIGYWGQEATLGTPAMVLIGFVVGVAGSTLGIGGGFLLVPILVIAYGLPLYVVVAASIPYVIVLSLAGLFGYLVALPWLTGASIVPDWGFALFVAAGAIAGSWLAAKTQRFIPEVYLKPMLGALTGVIGALYLVNYFWRLPFQV